MHSASLSNPAASPSGFAKCRPQSITPNAGSPGLLSRGTCGAAPVRKSEAGDGPPSVRRTATPGTVSKPPRLPLAAPRTRPSAAARHPCGDGRGAATHQPAGRGPHRQAVRGLGVEQPEERGGGVEGGKRGPLPVPAVDPRGPRRAPERHRPRRQRRRPHAPPQPRPRPARPAPAPARGGRRGRPVRPPGPAGRARGGLGVVGLPGAAPGGRPAPQRAEGGRHADRGAHRDWPIGKLEGKRSAGLGAEGGAQFFTRRKAGRLRGDAPEGDARPRSGRRIEARGTSWCGRSWFRDELVSDRLVWDELVRWLRLSPDRGVALLLLLGEEEESSPGPEGPEGPPSLSLCVPGGRGFSLWLRLRFVWVLCGPSRTKAQPRQRASPSSSSSARTPRLAQRVSRGSQVSLRP